MIWSVVQQIGGQVATLIVYFALAALLPPRDFGLVGMAGAWLAVLNTFCETGFGAALIQRDQVRGEHLSSTFAVNLAMGAALTLLGIVLSYPAARFFSTPDLQPVMAVLSLAFLMRAFGLTQVALAQRELRFRALALRDVSANVLGGSAGLALALAGYGVWSLVGMTLVNGLVATVMVWRLGRWRPRLSEISRGAVAELWPYSSRILGFNLFKAFAQNVDRMIIGRLLGVHALGVYSFASRSVIYPVTTFVGALGAYLFPRIARLQADAMRVKAIYRAVLIAVLNVILPLMASIVAVAPSVIPILGKQWNEAIPLIQILALAALAQAIISPVGQVMKGLGRPGWLVIWSVGQTLAVALAMIIGAAGGLRGASIAYVVVHALALPTSLVIGWRLTGLGAAELARIAWRPMVSAAALGLALSLAARYTAAWSRPTVVIGALVLGMLYFAVAARLNPEFVRLAGRELGKLRFRGEKAVSVVGMPPRG
ncbi:MAG TPA: lipopolysaccharide biosynthesis protein [Gemmatimonadales bacterium]|nr:lipopolysaccharide biosynthesis protein [Gemmatimonadales bacterium]